jgi:hypothetical protein
MGSAANPSPLEDVCYSETLLHEALIVPQQSAQCSGSQRPTVALPVVEFVPQTMHRARNDHDAPTRGAQNALQAIGEHCMGPYPHPKLSMRITRPARRVSTTIVNQRQDKAIDNHRGVTFSDQPTNSRSATPGKHGFPTGPLTSRLRKAGGGPVDNPATAVHHLQNRILCSENRSHLNRRQTADTLPHCHSVVLG